LLTVVSALILGDSLASVDPVKLVWDQLRLLLINFILVNLWEETAWAGVMQTRLEQRYNIFVAAVLTAVPFGFVHLPLAFLSDVTIASVLISLVFSYCWVLSCDSWSESLSEAPGTACLQPDSCTASSTEPTTGTASLLTCWTACCTGSRS
jgi:membrane protease YdiL (CAAX protease family)